MGANQSGERQGGIYQCDPKSLEEIHKEKIEKYQERMIALKEGDIKRQNMLLFGIGTSVMLMVAIFSKRSRLP